MIWNREKSNVGIFDKEYTHIKPEHFYKLAQDNEGIHILFEGYLNDYPKHIKEPLAV